MPEDTALGCSVNGRLLDRVGCILTYGGSTKDIIINYSMLAINMFGCMALLSPNMPIRAPILSFVLVWIFQIGLCLALAHASDDGYGCAGISLVWCAMAGWMWWRGKSCIPSNLRITRRQREDRWNRVVLACNFGALAYYSITEEFITTLAHGLAFVMGWLLSWLVTYR